MENLLTMPVRPFEVMMGKILPYIIVGYIQAAVVLAAAYGAGQLIRSGWFLGHYAATRRWLERVEAGRPRRSLRKRGQGFARRQRIARIKPGLGIEHQRHIGHRARHRPGCVL